MAHTTHIVRVANPRRTRGRPARSRVAKRANAGRKVHRRRSTATRRKSVRKAAHRKAPVIRRYATKMLKRELRRRGVKANPVKRRARRHVRHKRRAKARRRSNPVPVLIELGAVNPRKKRRKSVAKRRRRVTRRRRVNVARRVHHRRRRRSNPVVRHHRRRRVHARTRRVNRRRGYRRNPSVFGVSSGKGMAEIVLGGLAGVAATKFLPTLIPSQLTSSLGTSPMVSVLVTGAGAFAAGWLAKKFMPGSKFADGVLFGGLMQTGSAVLGAFVTPNLPYAARLQLAGIGDIVPGYFPVPQNPVTSRAALMPTQGVGAFRGAFGGRR